MVSLTFKSKVSPAFSVPAQTGNANTPYTFNHNLGRVPHTVLGRRQSLTGGYVILDLIQDVAGTNIGCRVETCLPNSCTVSVFRVAGFPVDCELVIVG